MKRLSIALTAVGISVSALAALPAATDPTIVAVPQLPGGFFIGGTAYYLQPSDTHGDLDYATVNVATTTASSLISIKHIEPGYDWGWGINAGYIFPGTGNDMEVSYFNLSTKDNDYVKEAGAPGTVIVNPDGSFTFPSPFVSPIVGISPVVEAARFAGVLGLTGLATRGNFITTQAQYTFNRVDWTVGQYIDIGCRLIVHPKFGLTWAQIERELTTNSAGSVIGNNTTDFTLPPLVKVSEVQETNEDSKFNGIGPIFGVDSSYYLTHGFGLVGHVDTALLIGDINKKINDSSTVFLINNITGDKIDIFPADGFPFSAESTTRRVVPVVDGKLGLDYTFVFNNTANSDLTLEAGWQVSNYFNAVDRTAPLLHTSSDVGLNGPYASLVWHI